MHPEGDAESGGDVAGTGGSEADDYQVLGQPVYSTDGGKLGFKQ